MIDHVEALLARGPIDRGDVDDADELTGRIVAQEACDLDDVGGLGVHGQLAAHDLIAGDGRAARALDDLAKSVERLVHSGPS